MDIVKIMESVGKIEKEMQLKGETSFIFTNDEISCMFSVYFLNPKLNIGSSGKISTVIQKLRKEYNIRSISIGKTVTVYLEQLSGDDK